jgi:hypothetical protein
VAGSLGQRHQYVKVGRLKSVRHISILSICNLPVFSQAPASGDSAGIP